MNEHYDAIIVGAGLAGLTAAIHLEEYNLKPLIIERDSRVGGRVKTDELNGFLLDHGFQVLLEEYPMAKKYLDYHALQLQPFTAGAICFNGPEKFKVKDTKRNPLAAVSMAFSPVGSFMDKIRLGNLVAELQKQSLEVLFDKPEMPTIEYLKKRGFSKKIVNRFFKPFLGGIFLDQELSTSSRMFEFVFKLFSEGNTSIPAGGMEEIPKQLKSRLSKTQFMFNTEVKNVSSGVVTLKNGEQVFSEQIIVTIPGIIHQETSALSWNSTSTFYFEADKTIIGKPLIALNHGKNALVNNFVILTDASKAYAPKGKVLVSASLTHSPTESVEETSRRIKNELALSFGVEVQKWKYLKSYQIKKALPRLTNLKYEMPLEEALIADGVYVAGDYLLNPSINAAMQSGEAAAKALVLHYSS